VRVLFLFPGAAARLANAAAAVLVVATAAALLVACGTSSPAATGFAGYWQSAPSSQLGGTLLIRIDKRGTDFSIVGLTFLGAAADRATPAAGKLVVRGTGSQSRGYEAQFVLGHAADKLTLTLVRSGQAATPMLSVAMIRAVGSNAQLAAALAAEQQHVRILKVEANVHVLQKGLKAWATAHGGTYPAPALVAPGSRFARVCVQLAQKRMWPTNPYTGGTMQPGSGPGEYTYTVASGGKSYTLAAHFPQGADYIVP
jgi:hypothetical protein